MESENGNRSSSARSEKVERLGERQEQMERDCSSGQNPQWAVVPMEEGSNCRVVGLLLKYGEIKTTVNCLLGTSLRYLIRIPTSVSLVWRFEAIWTSNGCVDQQRNSVFADGGNTASRAGRLHQLRCDNLKSGRTNSVLVLV
jgi:hypothetical protein